MQSPLLKALACTVFMQPDIADDTLGFGSGRRGSLPAEVVMSPEDDLVPMERTTSLATSLSDYHSSPTRTTKKRKGEKGGTFAKIDAWWGAVRSSFTAQQRSNSEEREIEPRQLQRNPSKLSLKLASGISEDMPPPPVPLRRSRSRPSLANLFFCTSQSCSWWRYKWRIFSKLGSSRTRATRKYSHLCQRFTCSCTSFTKTRTSKCAAHLANLENLLRLVTSPKV